MTDLTISRKSRLFGNDFDAPPAPPPSPEPERTEPVFTAGELDAARAEGWQEGHAAALAEAARAHEVAARDLLATVAAELAGAHAAADVAASESAQALARLLFDSFAVAFPAMAARCAEAEVRSVVRRILPRMQNEPQVTVRVAPEVAEIVRQDIEDLNPDLAGQVRIVPVESMPDYDIRITWRSGAAVRDTSAIWSDIESILLPAGMLSQSSGISELNHAG
jgi:flagellar assembly protein FliH